MAANILFLVYGPSGVPINGKCTWTTLNRQMVNYFQFAIALFQNGR
jgi:hypothetical protein